MLVLVPVLAVFQEEVVGMVRVVVVIVVVEKEVVEEEEVRWLNRDVGEVVDEVVDDLVVMVVACGGGGVDEVEVVNEV